MHWSSGRLPVVTDEPRRAGSFAHVRSALRCKCRRGSATHFRGQPARARHCPASTAWPSASQDTFSIDDPSAHASLKFEHISARSWTSASARSSAPENLPARESHTARRSLQRQVEGLIAQPNHADSSRPAKKTKRALNSRFEWHGRGCHLGRRPREPLRICLFAGECPCATCNDAREKKASLGEALRRSYHSRAANVQAQAARQAATQVGNYAFNQLHRRPLYRDLQLRPSPQHLPCGRLRQSLPRFCGLEHFGHSPG